jgi:AraC family transcriptional regulator
MPSTLLAGGVIPRHEHVENFLHVVLRGPAKYEVLTQRALDEGSPAGRLYSESLANALAVYLLNRYAARRYAPVTYRGSLPGYRLKLLDYIGDNIADDLSLSQLASVAGMSPHYFAEMFSQSTGRPPHQYVLLQRIECAKQSLRDSSRGVLEAGLDAGFPNPSHFARMFRQLVGVSPSTFQAESAASRR